MPKDYNNNDTGVVMSRCVQLSPSVFSSMEKVTVI